MICFEASSQIVPYAQINIYPLVIKVNLSTTADRGTDVAVIRSIKEIFHKHIQDVRDEREDWGMSTLPLEYLNRALAFAGWQMGTLLQLRAQVERGPHEGLWVDREDFFNIFPPLPLPHVSTLFVAPKQMPAMDQLLFFWIKARHAKLCINAGRDAALVAPPYSNLIDGKWTDAHETRRWDNVLLYNFARRPELRLGETGFTEDPTLGFMPMTLEEPGPHGALPRASPLLVAPSRAPAGTPMTCPVSPTHTVYYHNELLRTICLECDALEVLGILDRSHPGLSQNRGNSEGIANMNMQVDQTGSSSSSSGATYTTHTATGTPLNGAGPRITCLPCYSCGTGCLPGQCGCRCHNDSNPSRAFISGMYEGLALVSENETAEEAQERSESALGAQHQQRNN